MAYLPELQERLRRETEAGLRERLAVAEAALARLVPLVQQQHRYIQGSLPSLPSEWDEREIILGAFAALRDDAAMGRFPDLG